MQKGFEILEQFKNFINENYGGQFQQLNFGQNVEAAKVGKLIIFNLRLINSRTCLIN